MAGWQRLGSAPISGVYVRPQLLGGAVTSVCLAEMSDHDGIRVRRQTLHGYSDEIVDAFEADQGVKKTQYGAVCSGPLVCRMLAFKRPRAIFVCAPRV